jgi:muramoyltetrapeptide carboxypeptidase
MQRKSFLQLASMGMLPLGLLAAKDNNSNRNRIKIPTYLQKGDTIGICCPSGYSTMADIQQSIIQIESWGYQIKLGQTIGKRDFTFGGTDAERAADFQQMMDDDSVKAIMCATGGYGAVRIIDQLDFSRFKKNPKWIIGFSDITVLHSHLHQVVHTASLHSKMCGSFPKDWTTADEVQINTILSVKKALEGELIYYPIVPNINNRTGSAEGVLIGGNLKILENMSGSVSSINTEGKILFLEDVSEPLYNIDRMFCNLLRAGKLAKLKGLIIGGFTSIKPDTPDSPFGRDIITIVKEKVDHFNYPVCFDFPVGHQKNNYALKCGIEHRLAITADNVSLQEIN